MHVGCLVEHEDESAPGVWGGLTKGSVPDAELIPNKRVKVPIENYTPRQHAEGDLAL